MMGLVEQMRTGCIPYSHIPSWVDMCEYISHCFNDTNNNNMNEEMTLEEQFEAAYADTTLPGDTPSEPVNDFEIALEAMDLFQHRNQPTEIDEEVNDENVDTRIDNLTSAPAEPLPLNSESALIDDTTSRFSGAMWYNNIKRKNITLAGLGGIGSWVNLLLARMHPQEISIYDDDVVESANMSGQLYGMNDVEEYKSAACSKIARNYADYYDIFSYNEKFTVNSRPSQIMICGFDSMAARKTFFTVWSRYVESLPEERKKHCLFIDGRLAMEMYQVFCIKGDDEYHKQEYQDKWLFSDGEADPTVCSMKQTSFCANLIAGTIVNLFVNFCANELEGDEAPLFPRDLPFLTEYNAETMFFKTES